MIPTPQEAACNGICITANDLGVDWLGDAIAYAHPDCPAHADQHPTSPEAHR